LGKRGVHGNPRNSGGQVIGHPYLHKCLDIHHGLIQRAKPSVASAIFGPDTTGIFYRVMIIFIDMGFF
jgi:hypothetical protein